MNAQFRNVAWMSAASLTALAASLTWTIAADAQDEAASGDSRREVIVVTARKREETLQDVATSVQAFGEADLDKLNVTGFEDYARFAPSVSFVSAGPGRTKLVIRGVAESTGTRTGESSAAIYLDEQPLTSNSLTPDPKIFDVDRVEILSGPQGTLYGASSQSGTLKIVTNKPDPSAFDSLVESTVSSVKDGGVSYDLSGMVNVPIVEDKLAVRVVGFWGEQAGVIDNVLGVTPLDGQDNAFAVSEDIDSSRLTGGRLSARWDVNAAWSATASYVFQDTNTDGLSDYDPAVGDLEVVRFFDDVFSDRWNQAALTVEGDLGFADLTSSSSYYRRRIASNEDNTSYMQFLASLAIANPAYYAFYDFGPDPLGFYDFKLTEERVAQEVRLASKGEGRWSWIAGAFYEKVNGGTRAAANIIDYPLTPSFASVAAYLSEPTDVYFFQEVTYDQDQIAVFGEVSLDITDRLTATLGGRYFDANNDGGIFTEIPQGLPIETSILEAPEEGFTPKANLSYQATDDVLLYATYSQGFRLGGSNRDRPGLLVPLQYDADKLTNYELGWKTEWLDGRFLFNGAAYWMSWDDFQLEVKNPDPSTFFFVVANVGQAEIKGVEGEFSFLVTDALEVGGSGTLLTSELSEPSDFLGAPAGTRLPVTPEEKWALFARYAVPLGFVDAEGFVRADYSFTGNSVNSVDPASARLQRAYHLANLQAGADADDWSVNLYVNNLFDERADLFVKAATFDNRITTNRPREVGVTVSKRF